MVMTLVSLVAVSQQNPSRLNSVQILMKRKDDFRLPSILLTLSSGAIVALFTGGGFFGAFLAGPVGDWLGRRLAIMLGAIIFCLGGGLQTGAQGINYLYAGRVIAGLGVGVLVMIVPLYQAEIAHPAIRGRITGLQQFMLGIGAAVASK